MSTDLGKAEGTAGFLAPSVTTCAVLVAAVLGLVPGAAEASNGTISENQYKIDINSFNQFYSVDVTRILEDAARQWTAEGSSRSVLENIGTTTSDACGFGAGNNNVWASAGCPGGDCSTCALETDCGFGNWTIQFFPQSCGGLTATQVQHGVDLQSMAMHEFGHALGLQHEDPNEGFCNTASPYCVMNPSMCAGDRSRRVFCQAEIDQVTQVAGDAWSTTWLLNQGSGWPSFSTTGWSDWPVGLNGGGTLSYGYGLGATMRTETVDAFTWIDETQPSHNVSICDYFPQCSPLPIYGTYSRMRPAVAIDTVRNVWWIFWRDASGTDFEILYATSSDLVTWNGPYELNFSGYGLPRSRLPVGAAYDSWSDSIAVVFANFNFADPGFTCTYPYGCSGELNLGVVKASNYNPPTGVA